MQCKVCLDLFVGMLDLKVLFATRNFLLSKFRDDEASSFQGNGGIELGS